MAPHNFTGNLPGKFLESEVTRREFLKKTAAGAGAVAATIITGGCGTSSIQGRGMIAASLDWRLTPKTAAKTVFSAPTGVETIRLIVSAPDVYPAILKDFAVAAGSGMVDGVPAGTGRILTAQGLDSSGTVTYQGSITNITVQAGQTTNAGTLIMIPVALGSFSGSIVLGSPTTTSIRANIFAADQSGTITLTYGISSGNYEKQLPDAPLVAGQPLLLTVNGLSPDTRYYYKLMFQSSDGVGSGPTKEYLFHTARAIGSAYSFTIQADSHLDENSDLDTYYRTLSNIGADAPDFHIDLGDTFMCEKHSEPLSATVHMAPDQATVDSRYRYDLNKFATITHSVPLFLVNGNHEGEAGWLHDGTAQNVAVWATQARQRYFLNPVPDNFYSGDSTEEPFVDKRASWYSWQWGNARFIVLDPFWKSMTQSSRDPWAITLGTTQYQWLQSTLASNQATFTFVFIHNLTGGLDGQMRGGIEAAPFFEWGGKNLDGTEAFSQKRPGWGKTIHQLLVQYKVTAVFHGHDHLYDKQVLDGVPYVEVPQPSAQNALSGPGLASEYHYSAGTILSSSGHIRVHVTPNEVTVQYIRSWLPTQENSQQKNAQVSDLWKCTANGIVTGSFAGSIILGSPTGTSIRVNIHSASQSGSVYLEYGTLPGNYTRRTETTALVADTPLEIALNGLDRDTLYYYRLYYQAANEAGPGPTEEYSFHTARSAGNTFTFCIQGDSHPERLNSQFNAELYSRTLSTAAADKPDFYLAIGDDFSIDQLNPATITATQVRERYTIQRPYLGLVGSNAPLFLINGNHEQAARYLLDGTPNNVAVWAQNARNTLYSQPAPDSFYSGNTEQVPYIGLLRNYFAWNWGDALFVVIDPYWGSPVCADNPFDGSSKRSNLWDVTHGNEQYQWFKTTLEQSSAKYKFVFAHHVMGTGRGGIELAGSYEWGGKSGNGTWGFTANRPSWPTPIHQLMSANKVTIFFQGHDHIWVRQQLDGVTYQTLPEPADPFYTLYNDSVFLSGDKFSNTGYTRVTVTPSSVGVEYVRTYLPKDEGPGKISGTTAFSYSIASTS